jgi:hypothetical protein
VGHEDLLVVKRFIDSSTPRREVFPINNIQIVSSHDLDQRAWSVHLALGRFKVAADASLPTAAVNLARFGILELTWHQAKVGSSPQLTRHGQPRGPLTPTAYPPHSDPK